MLHYSNPERLIDDDFFNELRKQEYSRLDEQQHIYLDYTGGNLYASSQIDAHHTMLKQHTFGNPHSTNPTSMHATHLVEEARQRILALMLLIITTVLLLQMLLER